MMWLTQRPDGFHCTLCGAGVEKPPEHFPCSRPPVPGFIPNVCPVWADGKHCFAVDPNSRIVEIGPDGHVVAESTDMRKHCACGAVVERLWPGAEVARK